MHIKRPVRTLRDTSSSTVLLQLATGAAAASGCRTLDAGGFALPRVMCTMAMTVSLVLKTAQTN